MLRQRSLLTRLAAGPALSLFPAALSGDHRCGHRADAGPRPPITTPVCCCSRSPARSPGERRQLPASRRGRRVTALCAQLASDPVTPRSPRWSFRPCRVRTRPRTAPAAPLDAAGPAGRLSDALCPSLPPPPTVYASPNTCAVPRFAVPLRSLPPIVCTVTRTRCSTKQPPRSQPDRPTGPVASEHPAPAWPRLDPVITHVWVFGARRRRHPWTGRCLSAPSAAACCLDMCSLPA